MNFLFRLGGAPQDTAQPVSTLNFDDATIGGCEPVSVSSETLTVMCADAPDDTWTPEDVRVFAQRFGGRSQAGDRLAFVLSFQKASSALRAALAWQRLAAAGRPRVALITGSCTVATFGGSEALRTIGPMVQGGSDLAFQAVPGTVSLSPATYAIVREQISREARDALVLTETDDDEVVHASIVLAPQPSDELSTFAGLGLT